MKIIYDVGSNNGDDIPYYFHKSDRVVAIEANPILTEGIRQRFSSEIATGKLVVENCAVTVDDTQGAVPFYVHKYTGMSKASSRVQPTTCSTNSTPSRCRPSRW